MRAARGLRELALYTLSGGFVKGGDSPAGELEISLVRGRARP